MDFETFKEEAPFEEQEASMETAAARPSSTKKYQARLAKARKRQKGYRARQKLIKAKKPKVGRPRLFDKLLPEEKKLKDEFEILSKEEIKKLRGIIRKKKYTERERQKNLAIQPKSLKLKKKRNQVQLTQAEFNAMLRKYEDKSKYFDDSSEAMEQRKEEKVQSENMANEQNFRAKRCPYVIVKEETQGKSMRIVEGKTTFCRSCFTILTPEEKQFEVGAKLLVAFQQLIQQIITPFHLTPTFCGFCSLNIQSLNDYKHLVLLKQKKFDFLLDKNDIYKLHEICETQIGEDFHEELKQGEGFPLEPKQEFEEFIREIKIEPVKEYFFADSLDFNYSDDQSDDFENLIENHDEEATPTLDTDDHRIQCSHCDGKYKKSYIDIHIEKVHKIKLESTTKAHQCPTCGDFTTNMSRHHKTHKRKCLKCPFTTYDLIKMEKHVYRKHSPPQPCPICNKYFFKDALETHLKKFHDPSRRLQCDNCPYTTLNRGSLVVHMNRFHNLTPSFLSCELCEFKCLSRNNLAYHMKKRHAPSNGPKKLLACSICGKTYTSKHYVDEHVARIHEKIRNHVCKICNRAFFMKSELRIHTENQHGERNSICELCGKKFASEMMLAKHLVSHNKRDIVCNHCGKKFKTQNHVKKHVQVTHLKQKSHYCKICNEGFTNRCTLRYHIMKHAGVKFFCFVPGCTSGLTRKDALVFHMKHNHDLHPDEEKEFMEKLDAFYKETLVRFPV